VVLNTPNPISNDHKIVPFVITISNDYKIVPLGITTWKNPPNCQKSLKYFITSGCIEFTLLLVGVQIETSMVIGNEF
jgi:hypothetical protein